MTGTQQAQRLAAIRAVVSIGDGLNNETARFLLGRLDDALKGATCCHRQVLPGEVFTYLREHGGGVDEHDPDAIIDLTLWINRTVATEAPPAPAALHEEVRL